MKRKKFFIFVLKGFLGASISRLAKSSAPNIILLIAKDISPALGSYADRFAITPNLDRLAFRSIVDTNAWSIASICVPSRSWLISGVYATSLGYQHLQSEITVPFRLETLPGILKAEAYFIINRDHTDYNFSPEELFDHWSSSITPWRNKSPS